VHRPKVRSTPLQMLLELTANAEPKFDLKRQRKKSRQYLLCNWLEATSKSSIDDDRVLSTFMSELQLTARAMAAR
jgi:hypothetical protein